MVALALLLWIHAVYSHITSPLHSALRLGLMAFNWELDGMNCMTSLAGDSSRSLFL